MSAEMTFVTSSPLLIANEDNKKMLRSPTERESCIDTELAALEIEEKELDGIFQPLQMHHTEYALVSRLRIAMYKQLLELLDEEDGTTHHSPLILMVEDWIDEQKEFEVYRGIYDSRC